MHPIIALYVADARRADAARAAAAAQLGPRRRHRARPPGPSRPRLAAARILASAAQRLAAGQSLEELRHA